MAANFISPAQVSGMSKGRRPSAAGGAGPAPVGAVPGTGPDAIRPAGDPVPADDAPSLMSGLGHMGEWADKIHPVR